jgi:CHASE3 domain sensor protein
LDRQLGNRILIGHASIALVIVLSAVTALVALGSTVRRAERTREIEARLTLLRDLRADARELAASARRYLLSGNAQDRQRVFAIDAELRSERDALRAQSSYPPGWVADLDEYSATLTTAMSRTADDVATIAHFEDELLRVHNALDLALDSIVARERAHLDKLQSSTTLARRAQWALAVVSALGLALVVLTGLAAFRLLVRRAQTAST